MNDLLVKLRKAYPDKYADLKKAYEFAEKAHAGQKRSSGEDYFIHPCAVVEILADYGFDSSTLIAAFLHDVLEDTAVTPEQLAAEFGQEILELVQGVTKLDKLQFTNREDAQAENFRKFFMAMAKDLRVIIIKLADRLHNMRSLGFVPPEKQQRVAKETLDIYAPLAGRLGISFFKCELEDLAMMYLYPDEYKYITECISKKRGERQALLDGIMEQIREKMKEMGIDGEVNGRPKHFYSIYKKMHQLHIDVDQIYDLLAARIIVHTVKDCYTMLGEVHTMWKPIPGRFKDYIAMPKANNYQSLHTTVVADGETFEIQIRTYEMHRIAEYGIAAHWKYKEGTTGVDTDLDNKVRWLREVMDAEKNVGDAKEFMDAIKINVFDDEVFVFTPKGDVYDLPVGSTPVDLAYKIHSAIGNKCTGAKINRKIVPLSTKLQTGDIVEILTQNGKGPSLDWLKFVKTSSARSRIRQYFKKEQREENVHRGREMLEKEARRRGFSLADLMQVDALDSILQRMSLANEEDMYANVGFGGISTAQVLSKIRGGEEGALQERRAHQRQRELHRAYGALLHTRPRRRDNRLHFARQGSFRAPQGLSQREVDGARKAHRGGVGYGRRREFQRHALHHRGELGRYARERHRIHRGGEDADYGSERQGGHQGAHRRHRHQRDDKERRGPGRAREEDKKHTRRDRRAPLKTAQNRVYHRKTYH